MDSTTHPFNREEVMSYLDGELAPERASAAAAHLEQCAECRALAADLRAVSRQMPEWEVEAIPAGMQQRVLLAAELQEAAKAPGAREERPARSWMGVRLPTWATSIAVAVLLLIAFGALRQGRYEMTQTAALLRAKELSALESRSSSYATRESPNAPGPPPAVALRDQASQATSAVAMAKKAPAAQAQAGESGPMIVRRASLAVLTKEFDAARSALENLVKAHQGYFGELNVATPASAGRSLAATVRVPAVQLDAVLVE